MQLLELVLGGIFTLQLTTMGVLLHIEHRMTKLEARMDTLETQ
jgi:hypothetical protein